MMGKISQDHEAIYVANIAEADDKLRGQWAMMVTGLDNARAFLSQREGKTVVSVDFWKRLKKRMSAAFSDEYLLLFPELDGIITTGILECDSWIESIRTRINVDPDAQYETLDAILMNLKDFMYGKHYA